ncbi:MAG: hypothetical protein ACK5M4_10190 [Pseudorhodobacter sp.]
MTISEAIIPLGKAALQPAGDVPELGLLNGHTLLVWALEEALRAGARRILLTAPEDYAAAADLEIAARRTVAEAALRDKPVVGLVTADPAQGPEGWDGLIRLAAASCSGHRVLLIDPLMPLMVDGQVLSSVSLQMRQAMDGRPDRPRLLALAEVTWDEALALPRVCNDNTGLAFMADTGDCARMQTIFAGRAIFAPALPDYDPAIARNWPPAYRFPYETLVQHILSDGVEGYPTQAEALDFTAPRAARRKQTRPIMAKSPGRRFVLRVRPDPDEGIEPPETGKKEEHPSARLEFSSNTG